MLMQIEQLKWLMSRDDFSLVHVSSLKLIEWFVQGPQQGETYLIPLVTPARLHFPWALVERTRNNAVRAGKINEVEFKMSCSDSL